MENTGQGVIEYVLGKLIACLKYRSCVLAKLNIKQDFVYGLMLFYFLIIIWEVQKTKNFRCIKITLSQYTF